MGISGPFRKWRRNSYASPPSSAIQQTGKLDLFHNDTSCRQVLVTPPPSNNSSKSKKQLPPSPDLYLSGIGDYTFIKQIGQGKFSKVLLAFHYQTKKQVAIKMIDKRMHSYGVMSRLAREIALMELLDHPNIVQLYETHETSDSLFIVMEYIEGCNLEEYLQKHKGKLSEAEARSLFRQMVAALDYCHSKWVVHRDIKAPNVLLTVDNKVKIADFGLGNRYGRRRLKTICGSKLYYSPEIINGQGYTGPEIDCWCLGVLLYRMAVGKEPFAKAKTMGELKRDVTTGNFNIPETLSPELQLAILKCMSIDKSKRLRLSIALKDDPWLSNHDQLPSVIHQNSEIPTAESMKAQYIKETEKEKKFIKRKTITCHPKIPSIYFTSSIPHSSKPGENNSEAQRHKHLQTINDITRQTQLSKDTKSPIRQLLRKMKPNEHLMPSRSIRKTSSNMSLSRIFAQDQTYYYTFRSGTDESVLMQLLQTTCNSMGITYHRESEDRLLCVMNNSVQTYNQLHRKDSKLDSSQTSFSSMASERSINKFKRATSHLISSIFHSSGQENVCPDQQDTKDAFVLFSIRVNLKDSTTLAIKLSQLEGSSQVFRIVCNGITGALTH